MGNPNEAGQYSHHSNEAPPPYSANATLAPRASFSSSTSSLAPPYQAIPSSSISGVQNRFPQSLNGYWEMKMLSKNILLGEHADKPLFAVSLHSGLTKNKMVELHSGPNDSDPIIATADHESRWGSGRTTIIQIIPDGAPRAAVAGSSTGSSASGSGSTSEGNTTVIMKQPHDWRHTTHKFTVQVGLGKDTHEEEFEWRGSRGGEVKELDKWSRGWKLVRLNGVSHSHGGERATRSAGVTSDGKEVVAVYAQNTKASKNKIFKFQFLEGGATGVLGETFATAALMSALKIWYIAYVQQSAANAGAGA
ncbi:uncharacterized protein F4822DRAFT_116411 [Hypoxylon trugodes]|uniref:uncharacterized protein n=1 Tax=Hypoxylon trugodes TaxID=326681 RepID=UPI00219269B7|nr:uncharacterized protein F4822DRAFT_116411 [Hypoxylon trugodes]KAI1392135.1 hypothetical protein F4822DRAFT_116411 [Hypoxylon trugodes]